MQTEFELRILDIDIADVKKKLEAIGAEQVAERNMRRYIYDFGDFEHRWLRLRTDGKRTTLTVKEIHGREVDAQQELGVKVDDFDTTAKILEKLGFVYHAYQESKRLSYRKGDIEFDIDTWPKIPSYIEIEGPSKEAVETAIEELGFSLDQATGLHQHEIYARYGIELHDIKELKF